MPDPVRRVVESQGLKLRLWDHGHTHEQGAPRALFVHGYLDTGRSFDAVAEELAAGKPAVRSLALELRGHGESDRIGAGGSYHLIDHMKDLAIVLDTLAKGGERVDVVVAHSMGGNVAMLLAGAMPSLVTRLVLIDTCGPPPEDGEDAPARLEELIKSVLVEKKPFSTVASVEDGIKKLIFQNPGLSRVGAERMIRNVLVDAGEGTDGGRVFAFNLDHRMRGPSPMRWPESMWLAMSARMTMPVHVLRAAEGYVPEGETTEKRLAAMKRSSLRTVPGGHNLHVESPGEVAASVRATLAIAAT